MRKQGDQVNNLALLGSRTGNNWFKIKFKKIESEFWFRFCGWFFIIL